MNRNTTITYSNDPQNTPPVTLTYDSVTNGKGRLWYVVTTGSTGSLTTVESYDAMGRVTAEHQQFVTPSDMGGGSYWLNL